MTVELGGYYFTGPFLSTSSLEDRAGVYAILDRHSDNNYYVLDIGESAKVKTRIENHDRFNSWIRLREGVLMFAVYYTPNIPQLGRIEIEGTLRRKFNPPCGER